MPELLDQLHSNDITEIEKTQVIEKIIGKIILFNDCYGDPNELELNCLIKDKNIYESIQEIVKEKDIVLTDRILYDDEDNKSSNNKAGENNNTNNSNDCSSSSNLNNSNFSILDRIFALLLYIFSSFMDLCQEILEIFLNH